MPKTADDLIKLQELIEDQTALIEQLYSENIEAAKTIKYLTVHNKQLSAANDKQKGRIIHLNRQMKLQKPSPKETFTRVLGDSLTTLATSLSHH